MGETGLNPTHRILIVDDEPVIHLAIEAALRADDGRPRYDVVGVDNGPAALKSVQLAKRDGQPFSVAFVDLQLGSPWDGLETLQLLWECDDDLQAVLCTADPLAARRGLERLNGRHDQLLFLSKPFGSLDVLQFARALTSKWDLHRQRREYANDLERQVEERTAEIRLAKTRLMEANAELSVARDQADAASRAKSAFLANMSHEIRTPLTAVLGFVDLLGEPALTAAERQSCIETIRGNARHLLTVLNDILDLSRVEAGQLPVERRPFQPGQLLGDVVELLRPRAAAKGLLLRTRIEPDVPGCVVTDEGRVRQILLNLIGNAVKFTEHGHIEIAVARQRDAVDGHQLRIQVTDTGIGIAPDRLAEVFHPFAQADNSITRRYGGTGLGLTISRQLARLLGGDVTAVSEPGVGSSFELYIPVDLAAASPPTPGDAEWPESFGGAARPAAFRVLLVEDSDDLAELYRLGLTRRGCEIVHASDGLQAVRLALAARQSELPFDAVIMDMQMPFLDGYAATRRLRDAGYDRAIIAFTAHAMVGDRERCFAAGCDDYVRKPSSAASLLAAIQSAVQTTRRRCHAAGN